MTATSACRIELEALRERLSAIIHELKNAERMIEAFDVPVNGLSAAPATLAVSQVDVSFPGRPPVPSHVTKPPKALSAKPNGRQHASKGKGAQTAAYAGGAAIISHLGAAREPLSPKDLVRLTKLPRWRVMRTLLDMHAAGQLAKVGTRRGAKYALPSKPRPGTVAGTQAAPPVGPSSANGSKTQSGDYEVTWNGTKERNGSAPSIVLPRERRP